MTCESNPTRSQVYKDLFIRRCKTNPAEAPEIFKSAETTRNIGIIEQEDLEEVEKKLVEACPQIAKKIHIAP